MKKAKKLSKKEITEKAALAIEAVAVAQVKELVADLKEQTLLTQEKVEAELAEYKKAKMAEIDTLVKDKVLEISKQILGDSIDLKAHEELVIRALENAKRSGIL